MQLLLSKNMVSTSLRSEVKATLKAWSPGIVEACSRASFEAAMGNLRGNEKVTFERVCEIAAVVLTSKKEVRLVQAQSRGGGG